MTTITKDSLTICIEDNTGIDMWQGIITALIKVQELAIRVGDERVDASPADYRSSLGHSLVDIQR